MKKARSNYSTRVFIICFFAYALAQMDLALFGYAIPSIRKEFGLTLPGVISIVSIAFLLAGALIVWLGLLTDRVGRLRMFQFSQIGSSLLVALHSVVPNPATLALLRGTSIAVGGLTYPVTGAILAEELPARYRGFWMGVLQAGYPLGWVFASWWSVWILAEHGWRSLFLVGFVSIPFVLVVRFFVREPPRSIATRAESDKPQLKELFSPQYKNRTILVFCAQFLFVWAYAGSVFLFPSYLADDRGMAVTRYSELIGWGHLIGVLGYLLASYIGEFVLTRRTTVIIWTLLGAVMFQVVVWLASDFMQTLLAFGVMSMFFYGSAAVKFAYLGELFPTRLRATAFAFCGSLAVTLGSAAGPYMTSRMVEPFGWDMALSVIVGVPLVCAGLLYCFLKPIPSGLEVEQVQEFLSEDNK